MVELCVETPKGTRKNFVFNTREEAEKVKEKLLKLGHVLVYIRTAL